MLLKNLLENIEVTGVITKSRVRPVRNAIKNYTEFLGVCPDDCGVDIFNISDSAIGELIDFKASTKLSTHAIRNLKNNIKFVLRKARELQLLESPRLETSYKSERLRNLSDAYSLRRNESNIVQIKKVCLKNSKIEKEIDKYFVWSTSAYEKDRPSRIKKREITMSNHSYILGRIAKYMVSEKGVSLNKISLKKIISGDNISDYIKWWLDKHDNKITGSLTLVLSVVSVLSEYYLKDMKALKSIKEIKKNLSKPDNVVDKKKRWLSRKEIFQVAESIYPSNNRITKRNALHAEKSLLIKLMVLRPLRQRNIREMELNKNLFKDKEGTWWIKFEGKELKVDRKNGKVNKYLSEFPKQLVPFLEEWLDKWRPLLNPKTDHLFVNSRGSSLNSISVRNWFRSTTFAYKEVCVTPHMVRTIWATEYIKETGNFNIAANMLGDNVETVLKHYAHLIDEKSMIIGCDWSDKL